MEFDSVQIGVEDLTAATGAYELLLAVSPSWSANGTVRFALQRGAVELEASSSGLHSMRFTSTETDAGRWPPEAFHGLRVRCDALRQSAANLGDADGVRAIDHVVVHSPNLDRAIALWRDRAGLHLALDREFPSRGLRMLFFRSAGVTLEFVGSLMPGSDPQGPDSFYGVAYRVGNLERCRDRLLHAQVHVSPIRNGNKSGTLVATVRGATEGVSTLLIEDPNRQK